MKNIHRTNFILCQKVLLFVLFTATAGPTYALDLHPRIIEGQPVDKRSISIAEIDIREGGDDFLCSGTMIAPDVVLTASHCVTKRASDHTVILKGRSYGVSKVVVHPLAQETKSGDLIYDIALLFLRRDPKSSYFPILTSRNARAGDSIYIYGYGLDENKDSGVLKTGTMTVTATSRRWVNATYTGNADNNTCEGDSGGPAFETFRASNGTMSLGLVAVTAGGVKEDCSVGDNSFFTNLQSKETVDFLRRNVSKLRRR